MQKDNNKGGASSLKTPFGGDVSKVAKRLTAGGYNLRLQGIIRASPARLKVSLGSTVTE